MVSCVDHQWHIFVILTGSCIGTKVAPGNLSVIASIDTEIYNNIPLKFKGDQTSKSWDMASLKSYICIVEDNPYPPQSKMYGKTMILKMPSHDISFEILKDYCRPPYLLICYNAQVARCNYCAHAWTFRNNMCHFAMITTSY